MSRGELNPEQLTAVTKAVAAEDFFLVHGPPGTGKSTVLAEIGRGVAVACGSGAVELMRVKPEGKSEMDAADWMRGARVQSGERMEKEEAAT